MSGTWNPKLHPRDGENGRFTRNWEARLAEQVAAAIRRGDVSSQYLPVTRGHSGAPEAKRRGFVRVGEHPTRMGAVGGEQSHFGSSTHPDAGGIWIDPDRPGTSRAPTFRNDFGSAMTQLRPAKSRSQERQERVRTRRSESLSHTPNDRERRQPEDGGKIGRRYEGAPEAVVKDLRRAQARTRAETGRVGKRRTPRGTRVDGWMDKVNNKIGKGTRG